MIARRGNSSWLSTWRVKMNTVLRARKSAVILMTSAALVLAGCGSSSDSDKVSVDGAEQDQAPVEFQAETDFAGLTSLDSGIEFTATEASESNARLAPGLSPPTHAGR